MATKKTPTKKTAEEVNVTTELTEGATPEEVAQAEAEAQAQNETSEEQTPQVTVTAPEVRVDESAKVQAAEVNVAKADKMVKVATTVDHKCRVGGQTYYFTRGVQTTVPFNVKTILKNAGVLAAF